MADIDQPLEKKCRVCRLIKNIDEYYPRRSTDGSEIVGLQTACKACTDANWKSKRDKTQDPLVRYDEFGNRLEPGVKRVSIGDFTEKVRETAIQQIKRNRSLKGCADFLGVSMHKLDRWLTDQREPYASWSRRFHTARAEAHRNPIVKAMTQEAKAGNVRAQEFLLKTGWRDEFGDRKALDMTVRKGTDELDASRYSVEELTELRRLLAKGQEE